MTTDPALVRALALGPASSAQDHTRFTVHLKQGVHADLPATAHPIDDHELATAASTLD